MKLKKDMIRTDKIVFPTKKPLVCLATFILALGLYVSCCHNHFPLGDLPPSSVDSSEIGDPGPVSSGIACDFHLGGDQFSCLSNHGVTVDRSMKLSRKSRPCLPFVINGVIRPHGVTVFATRHFRPESIIRIFSNSLFRLKTSLLFYH